MWATPRMRGPAGGWGRTGRAQAGASNNSRRRIRFVTGDRSRAKIPQPTTQNTLPTSPPNVYVMPLPCRGGPVTASRLDLAAHAPTWDGGLGAFPVGCWNPAGVAAVHR